MPISSNISAAQVAPAALNPQPLQRSESSGRPSELAGHPMPSSPGKVREEGARNLAKESVTLRQFVSVALGVAALVRGLVAVGTLGLSELAIYAGSKAMASFGTKAPPSEGVAITLPGRSGIAMQGEKPVTVTFRASALPDRIPGDMTPEQLQSALQAKVNSGQALIDQLATGSHDGSPCRNEDVSNIMCYLQARGEAARGSFASGAFSVEDPGQLIRDFFDTNPNAYQRESSHLGAFQEAEGGQHRGIDLYGDGGNLREFLPNNRQTILYGTMAGGTSGHQMPVDRLFIKMESHGAFLTRPHGGGDADGPRRFGNLHDIGAIVGHTFSYLETRGQGSAAGTFKERIPDTIKNDFRQLLSATPKKGPGSVLPEEVRKTLSEGNPLGKEAGIRVMVANVDRALSQIVEGQGDHIRQSLEAFRATITGARDAEGRPRFDHLECRIGNEVILQSADLLTRRGPERTIADLSSQARDLQAATVEFLLDDMSGCLPAAAAQHEALASMATQIEAYAANIDPGAGRHPSVVDLGEHGIMLQQERDSIAGKMNADVVGRVGVIRSEPLGADPLPGLAARVSRLQVLSESISSLAESPLTTATRNTVEQALAAACADLARAEMAGLLMDDLGSRAERLGTALDEVFRGPRLTPATIPGAVALHKQLEALTGEIRTANEDIQSEALERMSYRLDEGIQAELAGWINGDISAQLDRLASAPVGRADVERLTALVGELTAWRDAMPTSDDGPIEPLTRAKLDNALATATARLDGAERLADRSVGLIESKLREQLSAIRPGDSKSLSGEFGVAIGISFNFVELVPAVGEALDSAGVKAELGIEAAAQGTREAEVSRTDSGFTLKVTREYEGRAGVAAGLGLPGLNVEAETARGRGLREEFTYQFANVQDLSAYLSGNREVAGLEQTPEVVAPGQFTAAARSSQFSLRTDEVAYTRPIGPGSRSTGGIGPGMRTTVAEMRSEMTRAANGDTLHTDLYTLTTRPGLAKVGKTASRVELAVSRSQPAMGALTLEEASLNMDISLSKLKNVTRVGADADRALAVLAGKMTDRINETLGNSNQRGGNFSTEGTAATVNAALKQLQAQASSIEGGGGLSNPQTKSLLGLSWRSEDLATIRFTFNEVNGQLALGEPMVGMTSEREVGFRLDFGLSEDTNLGHVHASAALTAWRQASDAPPPLMPAGSPAQGQEVRLARKHSQFFAARVTSEDGRSALQNPAVRLRIEPGLFLRAVQSDARGSDVQSVEAHLLRHLNKVVSVSGRTEKVEELSNGIDVERSRAAIRGGLSLIRGSSAALTANQDQARFTVAYEALQTRIEEGTVEMDYRLERSDVDGRWSLVNPATDQATLNRLVKQGGDRVDAPPVRSQIAGAADAAAASPAVRPPAAPSLTPGTTEVATKGALIATATGDRTLLESRFETNETDFLAAVAPDAGSISPRAQLATKFANRMVDDILPKASTEGRRVTMDRATTREGMTRVLDFLSANHDEIRTALASPGRTFSRDGVTVERQPGGFLSRDRVRVTIPLQKPIFPSGDVSANHILATPVSTGNEI